MLDDSESIRVVDPGYSRRIASGIVGVCPNPIRVSYQSVRPLKFSGIGSGDPLNDYGRSQKIVAIFDKSINLSCNGDVRRARRLT